MNYHCDDVAFFHHASSSGWSVSLSSNGSLLAVGGPFDNDKVGATWVFKYNGSNYSKLGSKLIGTGYWRYNLQGNIFRCRLLYVQTLFLTVFSLTFVFSRLFRKCIFGWVCGGRGGSKRQ